jgi:hypothetical protein
MAKFRDVVGYGENIETAPGVWEDIITDKIYTGDVIRNSLRLQQAQEVNDDLSLSHSISIVADAYANEHIFAIRYVRWQGSLWKISNVEVQRPRLILRLGGVYNGPKGGIASTP